MSQQKIIKELKKKDGWVSTNELIEATKLSRSNINQSLNKMLKYGEVVKKTTKDKCKGESYEWAIK